MFQDEDEDELDAQNDGTAESSGDELPELAEDGTDDLEEVD